MALGIFSAREPQRKSSAPSFSLARALVAGGLAGVVGGWAFGQWMEKARFFPLIAGLVGSSSPGVGKTLQFVFAVIIGATFGLLSNATSAGMDRASGGALPTEFFGGFSDRLRSSRSCRATRRTGRSRRDKNYSARSWGTSFTACSSA